MRLFILLTFLCVYSSAAQAQDYLWPTDSGQYLSSTFGETRSAHFHAGLDIKTWGREGYRVFAARDGILYRLAITERGYGYAIYLKHPDSTYTVYAHLQRFNNKFQALADSIRMKDLSFQMDENFQHKGLKVEQGEVIGYTGSTGIGPPHLHFEIRDSLDNPINALNTNLTVKDNIPPVFSSLIAEPLTKKSRINGRPISHQIRAKRKGDHFDFGTIELSGKAGLAVNVYDQANEVYNAYAVHSLALMHGADTLFYQELNTFSFQNDGEMFLDRIAPFGSSRRGHQRLYGKEGNLNPFYLIDKPQAQIQSADNAKTYRIVATDYFGNTSTAILKIQPSSADLPLLSSYTTMLSTDKWYWHEDWASPDLISTMSFTEDIDGLKWTDSQIIMQNDSAPDVQFSRIIPDTSQKIYTPDQRFFIHFKENTFFDTLTVASYYLMSGDDILLSIQPQILASRSDYHLSFYLGEDFKTENNYRLFRKKNSDGDLSYVDSELRGKTVHAWPSELGEFIIKPDNEPPIISDPKIFQTNYGQWRVTVHIEDTLSGVESSSAIFSVNGERGIAEYDYEEELLIYYHPDFTPEQTNSITISVEDKAGNSASYTKKQ